MPRLSTKLKNEINYLFKHKKIIDAFTSEFEKTVEKSWGQPLFCNSIPELRYDHVSVFRNIDFDSLNTPIVKLRNLAFEFLNENRLRPHFYEARVQFGTRLGQCTLL